MSEHNKNFYSLEEVERCLEASKEFQDGEEIYYFIGALRYVYNENKQLKFQLQQKENIMKEIREHIVKNIDNTGWLEIGSNDVKELLKMLDKEEL